MLFDPADFVLVNSVGASGLSLAANAKSVNGLFDPRLSPTQIAAVTSRLENAVRYLLTEKYASAPAAWYDTQDFSTMFQDVAMTIPAALEQPVAIQLDKSSRGWHRSQATAAKRAKLSRRYNLLLGTTALATQSVTVFAGSYQLDFSGAGSVVLSGAATGTINAGSSAITCTAGTLTLTVTGAVNNAHLRVAADVAIPYQRVTSAADYDADPTKFPAYLSIDGVDDAYVTATQTGWDTTSAVTVFAALQRFDNAATGLVYELGNEVNTFVGHGMLAPIGSGLNSAGALSNGGTYKFTSVGVPATYKGILTGRANILTPSVQARFNGVAGAAVTTSQGAGPYANNAVNWFARNQASFLFKGNAFGEIVIGAQMLDDEVALVERYLAMKSGVAL